MQPFASLWMMCVWFPSEEHLFFFLSIGLSFVDSVKENKKPNIKKLFFSDLVTGHLSSQHILWFLNCKNSYIFPVLNFQECFVLFSFFSLSLSTFYLPSSFCTHFRCLFILRCSLFFFISKLNQLVDDSRFTNSLWISSLIHLKSNLKIIFVFWRIHFGSHCRNQKEHKSLQVAKHQKYEIIGLYRILRWRKGSWRMRRVPKQPPLFHARQTNFAAVANTSIWSYSFFGLILRSLTVFQSLSNSLSPPLFHIKCIHSFHTTFIASTLILWLECICVSFRIFAVFFSKQRMGCCAIYSHCNMLLMNYRMRISVEMISMRFSSQCSGFNEMIILAMFVSLQLYTNIRAANTKSLFYVVATTSATAYTQ